MSAGKKRPARKRSGGIPFAALFTNDGGERNALMALYSNPFAPPELREYNSHTPPALRAELERYLANPLRAAVDDLQQLLDQRAQFRGRPRPESAATTHIRQVVAENPTLKPGALRKLVNESIIGPMSKETFRNKVAAARRK